VVDVAARGLLDEDAVALGDLSDLRLCPGEERPAVEAGAVRGPIGLRTAGVSRSGSTVTDAKNTRTPKSAPRRPWSPAILAVRRGQVSAQVV
jgi:hypothetical protein